MARAVAHGVDEEGNFIRRQELIPFGYGTQLHNYLEYTEIVVVSFCSYEGNGCFLKFHQWGNNGARALCMSILFWQRFSGTYRVNTCTRLLKTILIFNPLFSHRSPSLSRGETDPDAILPAPHPRLAEVRAQTVTRILSIQHWDLRTFRQTRALRNICTSRHEIRILQDYTVYMFSCPLP